MLRFLCVFIVAFLAIALAGCSFDAQSADSALGPSAGYPQGTAEPALAESAAPAEVSAPAEPSASPSPSPSPTPNDGRTVIADGFYYKPLDDDIKAMITGSSFPAEPQDDISYESLCCVSVLHIDFNGEQKSGELIIASDLADEITRIFYQLYLAEYPITSIRLIDEFGGSTGDRASMSANNTSAFNYRLVAGTDKLSNHALGRAIDINPMMNPYIVGGYVSPENGTEYADRSNIRPGMIDKSDLCFRLFTENGWFWGGDWVSVKDYQHFEKKQPK